MMNDRTLPFVAYRAGNTRYVVERRSSTGATILLETCHHDLMGHESWRRNCIYTIGEASGSSQVVLMAGALQAWLDACDADVVPTENDFRHILAALEEHGPQVVFMNDDVRWVAKYNGSQCIMMSCEENRPDAMGVASWHRSRAGRMNDIIEFRLIPPDLGLADVMSLVLIRAVFEDQGRRAPDDTDDVLMDI